MMLMIKLPIVNHLIIKQKIVEKTQKDQNDNQNHHKIQMQLKHHEHHNQQY